jgi:hypothetical protein
MKLPSVSEPTNFQGLYVFDFGEWTAVGYTAEEIGMLLESEQYRDGKVYRIVRATPDGGLELQGVAPTRFQLESGMFFQRDDVDAAREDLRTLVTLAEDTPPACRAFVQLADRGNTADRGRYVTALIYPAEYEQEMSQWLLDAKYAGGDTVEGGPSHVSNYRDSVHKVLERQQLYGAGSVPSRSADEVLASVREPIQRWA